MDGIIQRIVLDCRGDVASFLTVTNIVFQFTRCMVIFLWLYQCDGVSHSPNRISRNEIIWSFVCLPEMIGIGPWQLPMLHRAKKPTLKVPLLIPFSSFYKKTKDVKIQRCWEKLTESASNQNLNLFRHITGSLGLKHMQHVAALKVLTVSTYLMLPRPSEHSMKGLKKGCDGLYYRPCSLSFISNLHTPVHPSQCRSYCCFC